MPLPPTLTRGLCAALFLFGILPGLCAAPVPHPIRPDRLVETRDGLSVEYSPGQEAWMEMAFAQMQKTATPAATAAAKAVPGSARDLRERRASMLAAVARQVGLDKPTELQGRVFDTFLGHYELSSEMMQGFREILPATVTIRHMAIWQRDDLVGRLRKGDRIEGMSYDPASGGGRFDFKPKGNTLSAAVGERMQAIYADIEAQRLNYRLNYDKDSFAAMVTLGPPPKATPKPPPVKPAAPEPAPDISEMVFPAIYRGDFSSPPTMDAFVFGQQQLDAARASLLRQVSDYRDPKMVTIILHETAETGLIGSIIRSADRRWLCDGTANYVAWRVARDLIGPDFAAQVYNLDTQLRLHAALQPKINLVRWSATENEKEGQTETDFGRAHYAFATRVMFLLTERHGENALAQLWADVALTPQKKISAKTFAAAYRKRFKADLGQLIAAAEKDPIPAVPSVTPKS